MLKINCQGHERVEHLVSCYGAWSDSHAWKHSWHEPRLMADANGIPCFQWTDLQGIIDSESSVVVIDFCKETPRALFDLISRCPQNKHYIIFSGSFWPEGRLPLPTSHTLIYWPSLLVDLRGVTMDPTQPYFYQDKMFDWAFPKSSLFTHISGTPRRARDRIVQSLLPRLRPEEFVFRYQGIDHGRSVRDIDLNNAHLSPEQIPGFFQSFPDRQWPQRVHVRSLSTATYNQSYFNLVIETSPDDKYHADQDNSAIFVTEKLGRSLITGQPFVALAAPGYLDHVRSLGFQTYHKVWNEEYDQIKDFDQRASALCELVLELRNFDWQGARKELMAIGMHNQSRLVDWQGFISSVFKGIDDTIETLDNLIFKQ